MNSYRFTTPVITFIIDIIIFTINIIVINTTSCMEKFWYGSNTRVFQKVTVKIGHFDL